MSCEKDKNYNNVINENSNKQSLSTVTSKDIPEVMNFLQQDGKTELIFQLQRGKSNDSKSGNDDLVLTTAELNNIKKLTNSQGISNYTFELTFDNHQNFYMIS
jgi:hypothetical protein